MGAYRELVYGAAFFLSACLGAAVALAFVFHIETTLSDFPEVALKNGIRATPVGTAIGGIAWLVFRYTWLKSPRQ
jgi:hypothetical protein